MLKPMTDMIVSFMPNRLMIQKNVFGIGFILSAKKNIKVVKIM